MESALWAKVDEREKEEIKKQAKGIIDSFARELEKVSVQEARIERKEDRRKEGEGNEADRGFKEMMFKNAPSTKNECIEAEKGEWV